VICPATDKVCKERECKENGCLEERDEDGEEEIKKDV
jgi:hypothetical protein